MHMLDAAASAVAYLWIVQWGSPSDHYFTSLGKCSLPTRFWPIGKVLSKHLVCWQGNFIQWEEFSVKILFAHGRSWPDVWHQLICPTLLTALGTAIWTKRVYF